MDDVEDAGPTMEELDAAMHDSMAFLQGQEYKEHKVSAWTNTSLEDCVKRLTTLSKPFKYVVTCIITQKTGAGLHAASSCFWDAGTDGCRTMQWESDTMQAVMTVFALAL